MLSPVFRKEHIGSIMATSLTGVTSRLSTFQGSSHNRCLFYESVLLYYPRNALFIAYMLQVRALLDKVCPSYRDSVTPNFRKHKNALKCFLDNIVAQGHVLRVGAVVFRAEDTS